MEREEYNGINLIFWEGNGFLSFYSKKTPTSKVGGELRLLPTW